MKLVTLMASLAALAIPSFAADISGSWTLSGDVVGNAVNMKCSFMQDGDKISGTCGGDAGSAKTTGTVAANKVTFANTMQSYDLTYTGTLDAAGTSMQGEIAVAGVTGTFSATKDGAAPATASAGLAAPVAGTDISGSWRIIGDVVGNAIDMTCALKADGAKLSGNCTYQGLGNSATTGTVAGDKVTLQNSVTREQLYDLTYNGTLDSAGTAMKGDIAVAGVTGNFTATKNK